MASCNNVELYLELNLRSSCRDNCQQFNLITSFIQDSADKHIPSKTSRSVSSVPWITPAIRRKIRRKNATHAKAKKSGSAKIRAKFETLRREIKADIRKQHDLYVNNLVGDVKTNDLISSSELSDDSVSKFTSLVRAKDQFPPVTAPGEGLSIWRFTSKLFRFRQSL